MKRMHILFGLIILSALLVISGCSGSDTVAKTPTPTPIPTVTPTPSPTPTPTPTMTPTMTPEEQEAEGSQSLVLEQLAEIPSDYSPEQARADGCLVLDQTYPPDLTVGDAFFAEATAGNPASLLIVCYEPDIQDGILYLQQVNFDGQLYHMTLDNSPGPGGEAIITRSYAYLVETENPYSEGMCFILSQHSECTYKDFFESLTQTDEDGKVLDSYANVFLYTY